MAVHPENVARRYVRMDDVELVQELYRTIGELDDQEAGDRLYWLNGEILERWAPEVEWAEVERSYADDKDKDGELAAHAEALKQRRLMRDVYRKANERAAAIWTKRGNDA
jgi:hypothetical protein